jgi:hypothetical protein
LHADREHLDPAVILGEGLVYYEYLFFVQEGQPPHTAHGQLEEELRVEVVVHVDRTTNRKAGQRVAWKRAKAAGIYPFRGFAEQHLECVIKGKSAYLIEGEEPLQSANFSPIDKLVYYVT